MNAFSLPLLPSFPDLLPGLADAALKTFVLLAIAGLVAAALRRRSAAARHLVWCAALVGALLLPVLSLALPQWQVSFLPHWAVWTQAPAAAPVVGQLVELAPKAPAPSSASWATASEPTLAAPKLGEGGFRLLSPDSWLLPIWLAGTSLVLAPLLVGWWQIARITRRAAPVTDTTTTALLRELRASLGLRRAVALCHTAEVAMPVTWGAWRPVLLLPAAAADWSPERRRLVLLHELAHIARWDWPAQLAAHAACALHWFNPLAWLAARRMRLEREQACDDLVLAAGAAPCDYADELLAITTALRGPGWLALATVPIAHRSSLETRLHAILDGTRPRAALTRAAVLAALALATAIVTPLAMLRGAAPAESQTPSPVAPPKSAPAPAAGQPPQAAPSPSTPSSAPVHDPKLSVDYPDGTNDARTIIRNVADLFELNVVIPDSLQGKSALKLQDVTWRQIFTAVLTPASHTFVEDDNVIFVVSQAKAGVVQGILANSPRSPPGATATKGERTMTVDFSDEAIPTLLHNVARLFALNLVVPDTLPGKASIKLQSVTWRQIFRAVLAPAGYTFVEDGNLITVVKPDDPAAKLAGAKAELANLRILYLERHPKVIEQLKIIAELEAQLKQTPNAPIQQQPKP